MPCSLIPKILILDEATSAVDAQTEREIQRALDNVVQGRTTIAIAHRLSTLRKANKLIVLNQGRAVEIGTHTDLLASGGEYARLYRAQMQSALGRDSSGDLQYGEERAADSETAPTRELKPNGGLNDVELVAHGRGELLLKANGESQVVRPVRCFPLTEPQTWVSLIDALGRELFTIESLAELENARRVLVEEALRGREFLPVITGIDKISVESAHSEWHVSTNRGETQFTLGHDDHVRALTKVRFVVTDSNGMRYLVNDIGQLDGKSRRLLSRYF